MRNAYTVHNNGTNGGLVKSLSGNIFSFTFEVWNGTWIQPYVQYSMFNSLKQINSFFSYVREPLTAIKKIGKFRVLIIGNW